MTLAFLSYDLLTCFLSVHMAWELILVVRIVSSSETLLDPKDLGFLPPGTSISTHSVSL